MQDDFIVLPRSASVCISIAPVQNFICSLGVLCRIEKFPGLNNSLIDAFRAMSDEERENNKIVAFGLYYSYLTDRDWASVPAYLEHLQSVEPERFRDDLFEKYSRIILLRKTGGNPGAVQPESIDQDKALKDVDSFLDFIKNNFPARYTDFDTEALAYEYLINPPALKEMVISHLDHMWNRYLAREWEKNRQMLEESVHAFQQLNLAMDRLEAAETVTGLKIEEYWQEWPWKIEWFKVAPRIVFVPSAHTGPYSVKLLAGNTFYVCFNARLPEGSKNQTSDLNRNEINVRMNALADDTRLQVLKLITEKGELSSQEIMNELGLSQSAASRHLKQLSATGYLSERRKTCAKQYELNEAFVQKTLDAVALFLKKKQ